MTTDGTTRGKVDRFLLSETASLISVGRRRLFAIALSLLSCAVPLQANNARVDSFHGQHVVAGEIIVRFRASNAVESRVIAAAAIRSQPDIETPRPVGSSGAVLLRSQRKSVTELLKAFAGRPDVLYAEPNYVYRTEDLPNDPFFGPYQWGLRNTGQSISETGVPGADIKAEAAWDITLGSRSVVTAILDTGVAYDHPDLAANMWSAPTAFSVVIGGETIHCAQGTHGYNAVTKSCDPDDDHRHGTRVAGVIGAKGNNGVGISGVSREASMMALKFMKSDGTGNTADAIAALDFAIQVKALFGAAANVRIVNMSFGSPTYSQALLEVILLAGAEPNNMLFIASAGNAVSNNDDAGHYPSNFGAPPYNAPNVISVAAITATDMLAPFSNYGVATVDLGAPGVDMFSTMPPATFGFEPGTSIATSLVSGGAALVLSACPFPTPVDLKNLLLTPSSLDTLPSLVGKTRTGGRLNLLKALNTCNGVPQQNTAPTLTNITPNGGAPDSQVTTTLTGSNLSTVFGLEISGGAASITYVEHVDDTTIRLKINVPSNAEPGPRLISAKGYGGTSNSLSFTVRESPLVVNNVTPNHGKRNTYVDVTVTGTGFVPGETTLEVNGAGVSLSNVAVNDATSITATLAIAADAAFGARTLTVKRDSYNSAGAFAVVPPPRVDFDGDGRSDLLWRHAGGSVAGWLMNGFSITQAGELAVVGNDWSIQGVGDFDADGKSDVLWRNTDGTVAVWLIDGLVIRQFFGFGVVPAEWSIQGVGDFNGDGSADIVWRDTIGTVALWLTNGLSITGSGTFGAISNDWAIHGVADFNGDGRSDILWRDRNGVVAFWLMDGLNIAQSGGGESVSGDWSIQGAGDLDGDGNADIVWRHTNGTIGVWFMSGSTIARTAQLGPLSNDWTIQVALDINGDGYADLLWLNTNGTVAGWLMNGSSVVQADVLWTITRDWVMKF